MSEPWRTHTLTAAAAAGIPVGTRAVVHAEGLLILWDARLAAPEKYF